MKEIIKRMQNRIMQHQKENGFETIFDFLNEDLDELQQQLNNCNLQNVSGLLPLQTKLEMFYDFLFDNGLANSMKEGIDGVAKLFIQERLEGNAR